MENYLYEDDMFEEFIPTDAELCAMAEEFERNGCPSDIDSLPFQLYG